MTGSPLKRWKWRRNLARLIDEDPRFRLSVRDGDWLCPYCGRIAVKDLGEEDPAGRTLDHLAEGCPAWDEFAGDLLPEARLREIVDLYRIRDRFQNDPAWQVMDGGSRWVCPYCAATTSIVCGEDRQKPTGTVKAIRGHLAECPSYGPDQDPRDPEAIRAAVARRGRIAEATERVRREMAANPLFRLKDADHHWVCPYCERAVSHVDLSTEVLERHTAPRQIAEHLVDACPAAGGDSPRVTKTAEQMAGTVRRINEGKTQRAPQKKGATDDAYIKDLRTEIRRLKGDIRTNAEMEKGMEKARRVQARMLPAVPKAPGYEFAIVYRPCSGVGGDFYDFVPAGPGLIGVAIGDVSGHGIEAALVMGMAKKALNLRGRDAGGPADVLKRVNQDVFPDLESNTFVTVAYAVLDTEGHSIRLARAGHNFPLLYRSATRSVDVIKPKGLMVGINEGPAFDAAIEEALLQFAPGEVLLLYTDGVVEAKGEGGAEFGLSALSEVLARFGHFDAESLAGKVISAVHEFTGGVAPDDDVTMVVVRRKPGVP